MPTDKFSYAVLRYIRPKVHLTKINLQICSFTMPMTLHRPLTFGVTMTRQVRLPPKSNPKNVPKLQIKEEASYNEWLRRQALVEEEEEERRLAARKSQLHRELDVQIQEKNQKAIAKKSDVDEECHVVDAVIKQVMKC